MSLTIVSYDELDPNQVEQNVQLLVELNQANNPRIDFRNGVLREILLDTAAVVRTGFQVEQTRLQQSMSIQTIADNPTLATDEIVDKVLSNYLIERKQGVASSGDIALVLSSPLELVISSGFIFRAGNLVFRAVRTISAQLRAENVRGPNDSLLRELNNGAWVFYVPVVAEDVGPQYQLRVNTALMPETNLSGLIKVYAASNFTNGISTQTTADLVTQVQRRGLTCRALSGRANMNAFLFERYPSAYSSIVGFGDAEMQRDRRTIFPVSVGKRIDWWIRFDALPETKTITKEATLLSVDGSVGEWLFNTDVDDAPGYYRIVNIVKENEDLQFPSFQVTEETFGYFIPDDDNLDIYHPDIRSGSEARFTRYQTSIVKFEDTRSNYLQLQVGARQNYQVTYELFSQVAELQDEVNSGSIRPNCDILVKAAVPFFVSAEVIVGRPINSGTIDVNQVRGAVTEMINVTGITGSVYTSKVADGVYDFLPSWWVVKRINLRYQGYAPDGEILTHTSAECLKIPQEPSRSLTHKTTAFFIDASAVNIVVENL